MRPDCSDWQAQAPWNRVDVLGVTLAIHVLGMALPLALLQVYDRILPAQALGTMVALAVGVGLAIVLEAMLRYGRAQLLASVGVRLEVRAQTAVLDRLAVADVAAVERHGAAHWMQAQRQLSQLRDLWSGSAGVGLLELPFTLMYVGLIAYVGGWLALVPLVLFLLLALGGLRLNRALARASHAVEARDHGRREWLWATLAGLASFKASGAERGIARLYASRQAAYQAAAAHLEILGGRLRENAALFSQLCTVLIVVLGTGRVIEGSITTGALSACTLLAGRSIGPAIQALSHWTRVAQMSAAEQQVQRLLQLPQAPVAAQGALSTGAEAPACGEGLRLRGPAGEDWLLPAGERVCLEAADPVAASALLAQVAGTQAGSWEVSLDGRPRDAWSPNAWRDAVVLVTRHCALLPGTLLDNLTLFDPRLEAAAREGAQALGLSALLARYRHGLLTEVVALDAVQVDEGIYQRIALLRALIREPRVLLLDQAGSGLDLDGQDRLAKWLREQSSATVLMFSQKTALRAACSRTLSGLGGHTLEGQL
ncbi:MAG: ABC transporter transmembrane domain-containing protein [Rubrivivax sp.]